MPQIKVIADTKEKIDFIMELVQEWAIVLGLTDFKFDITVVDKIEAITPEELGRCLGGTVVYNYPACLAHIQIVDWGKDDEKSAEETIIHELLHVKFAGMYSLIENILTDVSPSVEDLMLKEYNKEEEHIIHSLARVLQEVKYQE